MRRATCALWWWAGALGSAAAVVTLWLVSAPSVESADPRSVLREAAVPRAAGASSTMGELPAPQPLALEAVELTEAGPAAPIEASAEARPVIPTEARVELSVVVRRNGVLEPQPHADLALALRGADAESGAVQRHRADAAGRLELALAPGLLWVTAWSGARAGEPVEREILAGESTELVLELVDCASVVGEVRDARSGHPIAGARVSLGWRREFDHALTDLEGFFELQRVAFSETFEKLVADADGYGPEQVFLRTDASGSWSLHALSEATRPVSGGSLPARVSLELWASASYRGHVVDGRGLPVRGARVDALGYYTILRGVSTRDRASTLSDEDGAFVLTGLRSDITHSIAVRASGLAESVQTPEWESGHSDHDLGLIRLGPQSLLAVAVVTASGAPAEGLRVDLRAARPPGSAAGRAPQLDSQRGRRSDYVPRAIQRETRTDASGYARFDELPAGAYELSVSLCRGFGEITGESVLLAEGQDVVAPLLRVPGTFATLEGWVAGPDGSVSAARVLAEPEGGEPIALSTDTFGVFRIAGLPVEARLKLSIDWTDDGGAPWHAERVVGAHERPELKLRRAGP